MSSGSSSGNRTVVKLFDAHCHLQDPRICNVAPKLIRTALDSGVLRFAVNGVSEKDWHVVKEMGEQYPSIIPCFGLHPWYVGERSPNWLKSMREFFNTTPSAAVGEKQIEGLQFVAESLDMNAKELTIGLDKGSHGKEIDFSAQAQVFRQQLELAKELERPVSVHCVRAFGDLLEIMQCTGPFPAGVILHSYLGSAEIVPGLAKLGAYFSFSGYLMSLKPQKAKKMLKSVPTERILLESDAPDALPKSNLSSLLWVEGDTSVPHELQSQGQNSDLHGDLSPDHACYTLTDTSTLPKETLNHPANIHNVLHYVASLIEMPEEELAELSYRNAFEGQTSFLCKKLSNLHNLEQDIMENEHISGNWRDEIGSPKDLQKQNRNVLSMETAFPKYTSQQVQTGLHSSAHLLPQRFVGSLSK